MNEDCCTFTVNECEVFAIKKWKTKKNTQIKKC